MDEVVIKCFWVVCIGACNGDKCRYCALFREKVVQNGCMRYIAIDLFIVDGQNVHRIFCGNYSANYKNYFFFMHITHYCRKTKLIGVISMKKSQKLWL